MEPRSNSGGCGGDSMRAGQSPAVAVKRRRRRRRRRQRSSPASRRTKPLSIIPPDNLLERWSDINQVCFGVFVVWCFEVVLFWTLCRLKGVTSYHPNELADIDIFDDITCLVDMTMRTFAVIDQSLPLGTETDSTFTTTNPHQS